MPYDSAKFAEKIKELMGDETLAAFASRCGLSRGNLSRLLNRGAEQPPSKGTLRKIADNTGADYDDLLIMCGHAASPAAARRQRPFHERIKLNAADMAKGFSELSGGAMIYDSLNDFIDMWSMLYSFEDCKCSVGKTGEYEGTEHKGAENYADICIIFNGDEGTVYTYAVIYYAETKGGKMLAIGAALDGKSLLEAGFLKDESIEKMGLTKEGIAGMDYVAHVHKDAKQMLYTAIFGESDAETFPYTVVGTGFDASTPPPRLKAFIDSRIADFIESEGEKAGPLLASYKPGENEPSVYFKDYGSDRRSNTGGWPALVADIIEDETGFHFGAYASDGKDVDGIQPVSIMVVDPYTEMMPYKAVLEAAKKYAKELGLSEYGQQVIYIEMEREETYRIEEGE